MRFERFVNDARTTLNGAINNSTTSIVVTDGSVFPSLGDFRILIDSELMLVTARSGNTLTVVRGYESTTAAAHNDTVEVISVLTKGALERFAQEFCDPFAAIRRPYRLQDTNDATLTGASFTNVNFGGSGTTTKTDLSNGSILLEKDAQSGANNYGLMVKSAPTPPWILTVAIIPNSLVVTSSDEPVSGAVIRDSTTGEFYAFLLMGENASRVRVFKLNSPTATETTFFNYDQWQWPFGPVWLQMEDDNTNLHFRVSPDGVSFVSFGSEARTTFLTPDQIGIGINNFGNPIPTQTTLISWTED